MAGPKSFSQLKEKVLPFFRQYQLLVKGKDFGLFAEIVEALERKEHGDAGKFKVLVQKAFRMNLEGKQRRHELEGILRDVDERGSSETIRRTP